MKFETKAIHVGEEPNLKPGGSGDVAQPIHLATTFAREKVDHPTGGYEYIRSGNPTRNALEKRFAALESAEYGLAFTSGLAAETTLFLSLLQSGDHVVAFDDLYGGSRRLLDRVFQKNFSVSVSFVDARNPLNVKNAIRPETRLIWLETPTNPLMKLCDIRAISDIARESKIPVTVDNTFMSSYFQNPLPLGADIVFHSTTKYMNGHSDSLGGAVMLNDDSLYQKIKFTQNAAGAVLSPFDSYLVLRGLKTLAVRMKQHQENSIQIAEFLNDHPGVRQVNYPGLSSHPQHQLARTQMSGFGGMLSFELDGDIDRAKKFVESTRYFALAESLGGVESLIEVPSLMTHSSVSPEDRRNIGLSDSLIRLSVGIENAADLIEDLERAFKKI
ncbi:MAG: aminotransferase class I/II-fold pyridoxal phosphate-dependent enzyme [Calditrichaeota bacterium]|nr:PLP-dependent transferase [Calditrichota bacterium]RQW03780.1 MAG: aminotransferase class I/II-fold pyridoxal phosphate-dependent enzyme [Calditrichota bacterium]